MRARPLSLPAPFFIWAALFALFLSAAPLRAQEEEPPVPAPAAATGKSEGFFLGLSARSLSFGGDFDGKLVLWHFEKAFYIPRFEPAPGAALGFGVKHAGWLWEMGYVRSSHNAELPDRMSRAVYNSLEISGKSFLFKNFPIQPYVSLGISVPWLKVRDGSEFRGDRMTAAYIGIGFNAGAGFLADITPHVFVSGGAGWRALGYYYTSGEGKGRDITELHVGYEGPAWKTWLKTTAFEVVFGLGIVL